jgi:O-antigen ligase
MRKIAFWLSLVMIFIIPWEDSFSVGIVGSMAKLMGIVVAGFWILTILSEGRFRKPHIFHAFVLFFFLWNVLSYMWSINTGRTIGRIYTYAQIFLLVLIIWELYQKPSELIAGLQAYVLGSYICIASIISNYRAGISAVKWQVRYSATGVNAVDLSILLLLGVPLAWHLFLLIDAKKFFLLKIINFTYIPLAFFSIFLTGSRTSLFAIIPAIIFILLPKGFKVGRYLLILMFLAVVLLVIYSLLPAAIINRLATVFSSIGSEDIGGRMNLWRGAILTFLEHPIIGSGAGALKSLIGTLAHQTFLSILAETGLIGFLLFCSILGIVINQAARLLEKYSGLWFSVFYTWVIGLFSLSWETKKVTWLFLSFIIIEAIALQEHYRAEKLKSVTSETEKGQTLPISAPSKS